MKKLLSFKNIFKAGILILGISIVSIACKKKTTPPTNNTNTTCTTNWTELGATNFGEYSAICSDVSGNIYATQYTSVYKINGTSAIVLGTLNTNNIINSICTDIQGNVYAAGYFTDSLGKYYVAKWNGTNWSELGTGANALNANGNINCITSDVSGNIYAAGRFTNGLTDTSGTCYVAKWNGTNWTALTTNNAPVYPKNSKITSICTDATGNLYVNNPSFYSIEKWDGNTWTNIASANYSQVLYADKAGNIYTTSYNYTSSSYGVSKWNGSTWNELGAGSNALNANGYINCITSDASGNIYVAGNFCNPDDKGLSCLKNVAKWDGTSWSELGGACGLNANSEITSICTNGGNIYAVGYFTDESNQYFIGKYY